MSSSSSRPVLGVVGTSVHTVCPSKQSLSGVKDCGDDLVASAPGHCVNDTLPQGVEQISH